MIIIDQLEFNPDMKETIIFLKQKNNKAHGSAPG